MAPRACWRQSTSSLLARPVASSTTSRNDMPSTMSMNTARPDTSVMIGKVCGSHSIRRWPFSTLASGSTIRRAPNGTRWRAFSRPLSSCRTISTARPSTTRRCLLSRTRVPLSSCIVPSMVDSMLERSADCCAAPPMWKVRMVSWVPGSPMLCAAITPTASPMLTGVPRARSRP